MTNYSSHSPSASVEGKDHSLNNNTDNTRMTGKMLFAETVLVKLK